MTKKDKDRLERIATAAMQVIVSLPNLNRAQDNLFNNVANDSINYAKALIAALDKEEADET